MTSSVESINNSHLMDLVDFFDFHGINYYIHAGFAVKLLLKSDEVGDTDDIDIRVDYDLDEMYKLITSAKGLNYFKDFKIKGEVIHQRYKFETPCLEFENSHSFDIVSDMITVFEDIGTITFPKSESWFENRVVLEIGGASLSLANIYILISYYGFYRRGLDEGKIDLKNLKYLVNHPDFSIEKMKDFAYRFFNQEHALFLLNSVSKL